jgi:diguanylate cyclase (GGDEF)-like protein
VLVVDDDRVGSQQIARELERHGYTVELAHEWTAALRLFSSETVDLVLMDAVMPHVDGFKLTKVLRERSRSYVPIVFLTGLADAQARHQGVAVGADDFLSKPVDPFELQVRLTAMLRIRRLTQDLEAKSRALEALAHVDALTGVPNRRSFDQRLVEEVARARRYDHPLTLIMLDIDHFKRVNDVYGHAVGDALLAYFGRLLRATIRESDLAFRYGGEEFAVIAPNTATIAAVQLAERVRGAFEQGSPDATIAGQQSVSIGLCALDQLPLPANDGQAIERALLVAADAALYRSKSGGRNRVSTWDGDEARGLDGAADEPGDRAPHAA